ncbi:hypothetical protein DK842_18005 [Chromobacterium phragmitis]|uniref:HGGxSTG domain-containing protein n=1 Tax=Chromobacterium phragmitis TaxID=2202141 RepID=UPI000DECF41F|nr:HGGxSTG domain-containing protein [Chromobacterium phragmitis]AXE31625.1 hypothetical protein DK842_18005 [Chromobacterium phragmitis]
MAHCGAKTRSGKPCAGAAMKNGRCRMHGGRSTGPVGHKNHVTPGSIYSKYMTPEEQAEAAALELGSVDEELRLTRIRLARALKQEQERADTLELESEKIEPAFFEGAKEGATRTTTTSKVRDYTSLIDRLTGRIESLEKTRAELMRAAGRDLDDDIKRLEIEKRRKELADPNDEAPTPVQIVVEVKDARKRSDDAEP